jgi:flagellin
MIINHNIAANNAIRNMNVNSTNASKSMQKLSSGLRINSAADDAAGLAISEKMRGQIRGLDQASANSQDAISLIQTGEGALNETHSILQRMRELAVQSSTDTNTTSDRQSIQKEVDQLAQEVTRISNTTQFNSKNLLAGGLNSTFQIGANKDQNLNLTVNAMDAFTLGVATSAVTPSLGVNAAQLTGTSAAGSGLTSANYSVVVTATGASNTAAVKGTAGASASAGAVTGTYNGSADASYVIKVATVDGSNAVTGINVSTDGGATFGGTVGVAGNGAAVIGNGLSFALSANTTSTGAVGETYTFTATAAKADITLKDGAAGTTSIGSTVTVHNNNSSATIGDSASDSQVTVSFNFATLSTSATTSTKINIASSASKAAVTDANGNVTTDAVAAAGINISTQAKANSAIDIIDKAIAKVSDERSKLGAYSNRLEHTIANLGTASENLTSAESRIRDVDMAKEMSTFSKNNILSQAAQAMLAQANQTPQQVLQLLR